MFLFSGESDVNLIDFDENSLRQKLTDRQHGNDFIGEVEDSRKKLEQYIKLSLCQNDPLIGESFWQKDSLITHILFELCLFRNLAQFTFFLLTLYLIFMRSKWNYNIVFTLVFSQNGTEIASVLPHKRCSATFKTKTFQWGHRKDSIRLKGSHATFKGRNNMFKGNSLDSMY